MRRFFYRFSRFESFRLCLVTPILTLNDRVVAKALSPAGWSDDRPKVRPVNGTQITGIEGIDASATVDEARVCLRAEDLDIRLIELRGKAGVGALPWVVPSWIAWEQGQGLMRDQASRKQPGLPCKLPPSPRQSS